MTPSGGRAPEAGLSLVEVLVALALFAVVSIAGLTLLNTVLRVNSGTEGRLERLAEIDRALLVLRRDLAQLAPGQVALAPAQFTFVRADADALQRQSLRVEEGTLLRGLRADDGPPVDQNLLRGVESARWRLLDVGRTWRDAWPISGQDDDGALPLAAELTLRIMQAEQGEADTLVRVFVLPEASRQ